MPDGTTSDFVASSSSESATAVDTFQSFGSSNRFIAAKKLFEDARKKATEAFNNTALAIEDRLLAMKLNVTAVLMWPLFLVNHSLKK